MLVFIVFFLIGLVGGFIVGRIVAYHRYGKAVQKEIVTKDCMIQLTKVQK